MLDRNRQRKVLRAQAKDPGLLAGLLYDSQGHAMSPTHTRKGSRRYRYYVSQAILQYRESQAGEVIRLPAEAIETIVTEQLLDLWRRPVTLFDQVIQRTLTATQQQAVILSARSLANNWAEWSPSKQIACLNRVIKEIRISRSCVAITFTRKGLAATLMETLVDIDIPAASENDAYRLSVPVRLKRCGLETRLIIDNGDPPPALQRSIRNIQEVLTKALIWNEALLRGKVDSLNTLAKREGVDQRHIARQLKLAWLAPDIMEAIARGDIPSTLSLSRLKKGFPMDWEEQRKVLGFTA
jgi:site-specific DNA recombinase